MFDKTTNNITNNNINDSADRIIAKTRDDSFMVQCKLGTFEAGMLFNTDAVWKDYLFKNPIDVVVLQTLYCCDGWVVCEVAPREKEKRYESEEEEAAATKKAIESYINRH